MEVALPPFPAMARRPLPEDVLQLISEYVDLADYGFSYGACLDVID